MVRQVQGSSERLTEVFSTSQMDFFKNSWTAKSQRRSFWVHREHAVLWAICGGCTSQCNEDDRQSMSAKNHVKATRMTPLLFVSQYLWDMGWTEFNVVHSHYEKQFFSPKYFCWFGPICCSGFRCSCKQRDEESFLAKRAWAHLQSRKKLKVSGTFRNIGTCLCIPPEFMGKLTFLRWSLDYSNPAVWGLDHHFINAIAFLKNGMTNKLAVRRPSTSVHYFALMPLSLGQKHHLLRSLSLWNVKLDTVRILLWAHPRPAPWAASQTPPACLQTASAGMPSPVLCSWQIWPC